MTDGQANPGLINRAQIFLGFVFYALFGWHQWWSGVAPRLIRGSAERVAIHHQHLSIGACLFVLLLVLLLVWLVRPERSPLAKLRDAFATASSTAVALFFTAMFMAILYGLAQAWATDEEVVLLGFLQLPHFLDWSWSTAGYLHSSLANIATALFSGIVFVYLYCKLRSFLHPLLVIGLLLGVHVLVNLPKPPSLHPIAMIGTYVLVPTYYLVGLALYSWAEHRRWVYWPVYLLFILFFLYLPYFAFKVLPPWHGSGEAETVLVAPGSSLSPTRARSDIFADDNARDAAAEIASWCSQCHNLGESDSHLLGPNLGSVFNHQAGTVEGYGRNSSAMQAAGSGGIYWTRENLAKFLTDGQSFIPNNLMNQQTDLSDPERLNQVIDYIEYLSAK